MTLVLQEGLEALGALGWEASTASMRIQQQHPRLSSWPRLGPGQGHGARGGKAKDKEWLPVTKLCRLVKGKKIKSLEEI